ncbi:unnamed protein product, partial [Polarella glacialis]
ERKSALLKVRDVASSNLREDLWQDSELRLALQANLSETEPELTRLLALGILVHVASSQTNQRALLRDDEVRQTLITLVEDEDQPEILFRKAQSVLMALATATFCTEFLDRCGDIHEALGAACSRDEEDEPRLRVLRVLWSAASVGSCPSSLWQNETLRLAIVQSCEPEEPVEVRRNALGILSALAHSRGGPLEAIWGKDDIADNELLGIVGVPDPGCRRFIFDAILEKHPAPIRNVALVTLFGFARDESFRSLIWDYHIEDKRDEDEEEEDEDEDED